MLIELTPREVEACRRLKKYTEMKLAKELYDAIANPTDEQTRNFMKYVREMCEDALVYIEQIAKLLVESEVKKDDNEVNEMLREAGPLSVYYLIGEASKDLDKKNKRFKEIEKTRDDKIGNYKKDIRKLEKAERELNKNINTLLYKISSTKEQAEGKHFKECQLGDSVKKIVSPETQTIIEENDKLLDEIKGDKQDNDLRKKIIEGKQEKDGYFEVKKHLDLEIARLYNKIEWQKEYAEGLKRQATTDNCSKKLEVNHIMTLLSQTKALSPSDCSDIFRLLGTLMEELDKLTEDDWGKIYTYYTKPGAIKEINLEHLKFCIRLQSLLRETSGSDIHKLFPRMPGFLARTLKMPDQYQIDRGERFVKYCEECAKGDNEKGVKEEKDYLKKYSYMCPRGHRFEETFKGTEARRTTKCIHYQCTEDVEIPSIEWLCGVHKDKPLADMVEQKLQCSDCKQEVKLYFEPAKHSKEKAAKGKCPKCKAEAKFEPVGGVKPFWKDDIRARWRDTWSSTFILEYNSVVRAIDRTFGLAEVADISGTTADSIFGMEAIMALKSKGEKSLGTRDMPQELRTEAKNKYWSENYIASGGYPGYVILLPLITMVKLSHHAILECALTFVLTGYIKAYHIGKYSSLWPKDSAQAGRLWEILQKWENSPSNKRFIIERDEDGFVSGGCLFEKDSYISKSKKYNFEDTTKLDYHRYINVFLPLRDRMKKLDENIEKGDKQDKDAEKDKIIDIKFIEELMLGSERKLNGLQLEILKESGERLKKEGSKKYKNYTRGLKYYSDRCSKDENIDDQLKKGLEDLTKEHPAREAAPVS